MSLLYEPSVADLTAHYFDNPVDFYHAPQESLNRLSYAQYATLKEMDALWKNVPPPVEPAWWPWLIQHGTAKSMTTFHSWGNSLDESSLHAMASREYKEKKAIVPDSLYREAIEVFQDHDKKPHAYELIAGAHIKSRLSMLLESQVARQWAKESNGDNLLHCLVRQEWIDGLKLARAVCDEQAMNHRGQTPAMLAQELETACFIKSAPTRKNSFGDTPVSVSPIKKTVSKKPPPNQTSFDF